MKLILDTAAADDRILAVYMNGSRTNPNVPKDIFQDYDIVYVVTETESFRKDRGWIDRFGERLFMQYPEEGFFGSGNAEECYGWLIQFSDGNRLDLQQGRGTAGTSGAHRRGSLGEKTGSGRV